MKFLWQKADFYTKNVSFYTFSGEKWGEATRITEDNLGYSKGAS